VGLVEIKSSEIESAYKRYGLWIILIGWMIDTAYSTCSSWTHVNE
jgi:hypothetical protein